MMRLQVNGIPVECPLPTASHEESTSWLRRPRAHLIMANEHCGAYVDALDRADVAEEWLPLSITLERTPGLSE
jgi:hypothetical protein